MRTISNTFAAALAALGLAIGTLAPEGAAAQDLDNARAVIEANIEATGGVDAWQGVEDMYTEADVVVEIPQGVIVITNESWRVVPGYLLNVTEFVEGPPGIPAEQVNNIAYITPDGGWIENAGGRQDLNDLPEQAVASFRASSVKSELDYLALPDSALVFNGLDEIEGEEVYSIQVMNPNPQTLYYSTDTLYLVAPEGPSPMGGTALTMILDYEEVGDVVMPFTQELDFGQGTQSVEIQEVEINEGISAADLEEMANERSASGGDSDDSGDM
ncbi:MAG: hypothetical protein HKN17_04920 [Rhodothermales bacterium]|nr:hypothetical protein [Rhodothermales bacterium]